MPYKKSLLYRILPITACLSDASRQIQDIARQVLELMFRSVLFLGKKGLAFRGDSTCDGILYELMIEGTYNLPRERQWIERRDNLTQSQNEVIQLNVCGIQREIVSRATSSPYHGLTAEGTTNFSTTEMFSPTLQYVDENLDINSDFLVFYIAPNSSGETLCRCIKDVFLLLNIPIHLLHGYCFDGAFNMSGRFFSPRSFFVHCVNHSPARWVSLQIQLTLFTGNQ